MFRPRAIDKDIMRSGQKLWQVRTNNRVSMFYFFRDEDDAIEALERVRGPAVLVEYRVRLPFRTVVYHISSRGFRKSFTYSNIDLFRSICLQRKYGGYSTDRDVRLMICPRVFSTFSMTGIYVLDRRTRELINLRRRYHHNRRSRSRSPSPRYHRYSRRSRSPSSSPTSINSNYGRY